MRDMLKESHNQTKSSENDDYAKSPKTKRKWKPKWSAKEAPRLMVTQRNG